MADRLTTALVRPDAGAGRLRVGVVDSASPLTVFVGGATVSVPCGRLDSYVPVVGDRVALLADGADRLVLGSIGENPVGPLGLIDEALVTANQGSITTVTDLTGLTVTWTAIAGRRYRLTFEGHFSATNANNVAAVRITDGSNTVVREGRRVLSTGAARESLVVSAGVEPSAGSVTYKCRALMSAGSGSVTLFADSDTYATFTVEDVGAA